MSNTYTQITYQIVFSTYKREKTLTSNNRDRFYKYVWGILQKKKCHLYRIGGGSDHVHIITHLHPSIALASLVKDIKISSSLFIKDNKLFTNFDGWQEGYGAFTYAYKDVGRLIEYVKNQEVHHARKSFRDEYIKLLEEHGVEFDEKYLL